MGRFDGRVALVTGASGGIGRAVVARLAAEGAQVACLDLAAADEAGEPGALQVRGDVTDPASCEQAVATTVESLGRLDVLVNVAGIGAFAATDELALEEWERVLAVNLTGTLLMSQRALPHLLERGGAIVNLASVGGLRATPYNAAYCVSKAGVVMLSRVLAAEFGGRGVRVNCVCPSSVDTPFLDNFTLPEGGDLSLLTRLGGVIHRKIDPEEVAAAVAYLASDEAGMVTGSTLVLDGGALA